MDDRESTRLAQFVAFQNTLHRPPSTPSPPLSKTKRNPKSGWHQHDAHAARCETLFCPAGATQPLNVSTGFYATGGNRTTRHAQAPCRGLRSPDSEQLLLGAERAPYCPTLIQGLDSSSSVRRADDTDDALFQSHIKDDARVPAPDHWRDALFQEMVLQSSSNQHPDAWDPPLFLGHGRYEWETHAEWGE